MLRSSADKLIRRSDWTFDSHRTGSESLGSPSPSADNLKVATERSAFAPSRQTMACRDEVEAKRGRRATMNDGLALARRPDHADLGHRKWRWAGMILCLLLGGGCQSRPEILRIHADASHAPSSRWAAAVTDDSLFSSQTPLADSPRVGVSPTLPPSLQREFEPDGSLTHRQAGWFDDASSADPR